MIQNLRELIAPSLPLFSISAWVPKDAKYSGEERDRIQGGKRLESSSWMTNP